METFFQLRNLTSLSLANTRMVCVDLNILNGKKLLKIDFSFNKILFNKNHQIILDKLETIKLENVKFMNGNYSFELFFGVNLKSIDLSENYLNLIHFEYISNMSILEIIVLQKIQINLF